MKKIIVILIGMIFSFSLHAQVDGTLSYQGYLTDENGEPVNDSEDHTFVFKFYDSDGNDVVTRTVISSVEKGLFSVVIGGGTGDNAELPLDIWEEGYTIGIAVDGADELSPRVPLTTVPYAFQAESANSVDGSNISGTIDASLLTGTIANGLLDDNLQALANETVDGSFVSAGIDAANITTGTLPNARLNVNLADLALDGVLSGENVGSGIDASNITEGTLDGNLINGINANKLLAGTVDNERLDSDLQDLAEDGVLTGSKVGTGIDAANITTGTLPDGRFESAVDVNRLNTSGGVHVGGSTNPGIDNLDVDGFTQLGTSSISVSAGTVSHPAIKVLLIEGTTASTEGGISSTTLTGMNDANIISINVLIDYNSGDYVQQNFTEQPGAEFQFYYQNGILIISNHDTNSESIISSTFKATIIYTD